ncbi:protein disulfide oxidoreductase [Paramixta manurensis]|uniref:Protein disulfide oxidoreductase n=1 Tax=Paramixta manurensis TaxID=2740817 RepID=A0A6M8U9A3_9GAMM|nr:protein disulfide oxidoreductase [Erwiniaceae bacterium PD-1]
MSRLKRWFRDLALLAIMTLALVTVMDKWRAPQAPAAFASQPLPTLYGETVTLDALSQQRPLLLYFWASWCGICRYTTPGVAALAQDGGNVVSIALRSGDDSRVNNYLRAKHYALPTINDPQGRLAAQWQVGVTPTYVILYQGKVVSTTTGWTSRWGLKLRLWWAQR